MNRAYAGTAMDPWYRPPAWLLGESYELFL
jgi:hypothetical protein